MDFMQKSDLLKCLTDHNYWISCESATANGPRLDLIHSFDAVILDFMTEQDIPGASVALSKDGKLFYCQGYGSAGAGRKVQPNFMFRIASISKTITAVGIMRLVQEGRVSLEDRVFGSEGILKEFSPTVNGDRRILDITVKHLLHHSAGWDRDRAGDPVFWKVGKHMNVEEPVSPKVLMQYMMGRKLQFAPGKRHAYSNLGYTILGQVIERVTGQAYEEFMARILKSVEVSHMKIGRTRKKDLDTNEVEYFHNQHPRLVKSIFPEGGRVPPQYGRWTIEEADAHGGWVATAVDLLKFLLALEHGVNGKRMISTETFNVMLGKPSFVDKCAEEWYGFGLDIRDNGSTWGHSGQMEGTSGVLTRHCGGYAWALLFNSWASDLDLDGLVKYALSRTAHFTRQHISCDVTARPFPSQLLPLTDSGHSTESSLRETGVFPAKIVTVDNRQIIDLMVPLNHFWTTYNGFKEQGFDLTWLNAFRFADVVYFNVIFLQNGGISPTTVYNGLTVDSCRECVENLEDLRPVHIETYINSNELHFAVVLTQANGETWELSYDCTVAQHRKNMTTMFNKGFNLTVQCLTEFKGRLHVTALYEKVPNGECIAELDIKPDHYQFEFNRQAKQGGQLSYIRAYQVKGQPRFSAIWTNQRSWLSATRHNVSKYGFLFELEEVAKKNVYAQCVSSYVNEGVLNFVASWSK